MTSPLEPDRLVALAVRHRAGQTICLTLHDVLEPDLFAAMSKAWVVDRNIIKLRARLGKETSLTPDLKTEIINGIDVKSSTREGLPGRSTCSSPA